MAKKPRIPHKFLPWIDARKKFRLSNAEIQMARELGLSPKRFAVYADRKDQPWKLPLGKFIQSQYEKQFEKSGPDVVMTMEEIAAAHVAKRAARKQENLAKAKAEKLKADTKAESPNAERSKSDASNSDASNSELSDESSKATANAGREENEASESVAVEQAKDSGDSA